VGDVVDANAAGGTCEIAGCHVRCSEASLKDATIARQEHRLTFNSLSKSWETHLSYAKKPRQHQQGCRRHDAPEHAGISANHGVLEGVGQHQEEDEVNGSQLSRLAPP
jgi:hypothetical protein